MCNNQNEAYNPSPKDRDCNVGDFCSQCFRCFENVLLFCFVVPMCDLLHDVETIFHILTAHCGNTPMLLQFFTASKMIIFR